MAFSDGQLGQQSGCLSYYCFALKVKEIGRCVSYTAPKIRISYQYYCLARYKEVTGLVTYIVKINSSFRLRNLWSGETLKIALADLYVAIPQSSNLGDFYLVSATDKPSHLNYPVAIQFIDQKVVLGNLTRFAPCKFEMDVWIFVPYTHVQTYVDPNGDQSDYI